MSERETATAEPCECAACRYARAELHATIKRLRIRLTGRTLAAARAADRAMLLEDRLAAAREEIGRMRREAARPRHGEAARIAGPPAVRPAQAPGPRLMLPAGMPGREWTIDLPASVEITITDVGR